MNPRIPDHIDLNEERLARELRTAAHQIDLTPGSELSVVTRGRRRRQRRRRATTFTLVTALTAGTAVGVQQLSRTGDDSIASETPEATVPTEGTTPSSLQPPPPTTAPPVEMATTGTDEANAVPEVVPPAQLVASNMEWAVVEPDSAQAVAYATFTGGAVEVPGVILATAPGRSDDYEPMLWRTDDGITWEPVGVDVPVGQLQQLVVDGSSLYVVGTAPGVAATEPNPLVLATSVDGDTWDQISLPVDVNADRDLPMVVGVSAYGTVSPYEDGLFVITQRSINLDWEALTRADDRLAGGVYGFLPDGVTVLTGEGCAAPVATTMAIGNSGAVSSGLLVPFDQPNPTDASGGFCAEQILTWDELGVPAETQAALADPQSRGFLVVDGQVTEVEVPAGLSSTGPMPAGARLFTDVNGNWYELNAEGQLEAADAPLGVVDGLGWPIGSAGDVTFTSVQTSSPFSGFTRDLIVTEGPDGPVWSDYTDLLGSDVTSSPGISAVTSAGLVRVVAAYPDLIAQEGGREASDGGLTVRRSSLREDPEFFLTSNGERIASADMRQDSANGDLVAVDADGQEIARMSAMVAAPLLYGVDAGAAPMPAWSVQTSANGRDVAVESVAVLLGDEFEDADISSISRISTDGTRTIIAVTLAERNADGVPRQLVLVGTPKA